MGGDAVTHEGLACQMKPGDIPFKTPDVPEAADMAKDFCRTRGLTPADVKICRRNGEVMVEVKRYGAICGTRMPEIKVCPKCFHLTEVKKGCKICGQKLTL